MPLHLNSFIPDEKEDFKKDLFANIITKYTEEPGEVFATEDKKHIHTTSYFIDAQSGKNLGKIVITLAAKEDCIEIKDADITLLSQNKVKLHFEYKREESSESNEYYEVYDLEEERHFEIETVNRYTNASPEIEGTDQEVYLSCFPFRLSLYDTQEQLDEFFGFTKEIDIPGIGTRKISMGDDMMAVGSAMVHDIKEPCSFIIGRIAGFRDVETIIAGMNLSFTIIDLKTGVGIIPVAVHRDNFDISKIEKDKIIVMIADVKADFKE